VSQDFMNQFIKDNQLDIDTVLKHHLLFYNLLYSRVWQYIFKTLPTKKDFSKFVEEYKLPIERPEPVTGKLLETIVNSFFPLKIGHIKKIDSEKLCRYVDTILEERLNTSFIQKFIIEKLCYRFNEPVPTAPNLFYMFVVIYKSYTAKKVQLVRDDKISPLTHTLNETLEYDDFDKKYMTEYEKAQYIIQKDNNIYTKSMEATAVIIDTVVSKEFISSFIEKIENIDKKNVSIFNLTSTYIKHDSYYNFMIPRDLVKHIPAMYNSCFLISSKRLPEIRSLSNKKENSIHFIVNYKESTQNEQDFTQAIQSYDRTLVEHIDLMKLDTKNKVYYLPKTYVDYEQNPYSFIHRSIIVGQQTYDRHQADIDNFLKDNNITMYLPNSEIYKADFVIDLYEEIDTIFYNYNGIIPFVAKGSPYITNSVNGYVNNNLSSIFENIIRLYDSPHLVKEFKENTKVVQLMYHDLLVNEMFKKHKELVCPFNDISPRNNIMLYYNFIYPYFWKNLEKIVAIRMAKESENVVVLIDNRPNPLSIVSVLFTLANTRSFNWVCKLYTSKKGISYYKKYLGKYAEIIHEPSLDVNIFHIDVYNELLKNVSFWKGLKAEKCLIIQDDGVIIRPGVEQYMIYDYIGAPWADAPGNEYLKNVVNPNLVGNGGLSLRTVSKMIEVIEKFDSEKKLLFFRNINIIPEDVYFVKGLTRIEANLPNIENAAPFSSEELCFMGSIGFHKLWGYFNANIVAEFFEKALV
jgi:hypothetical protein